MLTIKFCSSSDHDGVEHYAYVDDSQRFRGACVNCMAKCMWLPAVHDFVERAEIVLPYDWRIRIITMCLPAPATISWSVRELHVHMANCWRSIAVASSVHEIVDNQPL